MQKFLHALLKYQQQSQGTTFFRSPCTAVYKVQHRAVKECTQHTGAQPRLKS